MHKDVFFSWHRKAFLCVSDKTPIYFSAGEIHSWPSVFSGERASEGEGLDLLVEHVSPCFCTRDHYCSLYILG